MRLQLVWLSERDGCELSLILTFDQPGGKLDCIELRHPSQPPTILPPRMEQSHGRRRSSAAPTVGPEFGSLMKAIRANDVPVVVSEALDWVERIGM